MCLRQFWQGKREQGISKEGSDWGNTPWAQVAQKLGLRTNAATLVRTPPTYRSRATSWYNQDRTLPAKLETQKLIDC
jgi:hypothetical protein